MSKISVDVNSARIPVLQVGYQGENEVTDVLFDISSWITEFGEGVAQLRVKRPGNSEDESYFLSLIITDGKAVWTVSETDTANKGNGKVQLSYMVGNIVKKAVIYPYKVGKSIVGADNPVDPFDSWIERSKAWAIGKTLDDKDVPETDETYQNNAKYYAEQATEKATLATEKADAAADSEANAAASEAAVNGVSTQLTTRMSAIEGVSTQITTRMSAIETEQTAQDARMDTFVALQQGSTTGDAELTDIRVGADGVTYGSAGTAVRTQVTGLKSDLHSVSEPTRNLWNYGDIEVYQYKNYPLSLEIGTYTISVKADSTDTDDDHTLIKFIYDDDSSVQIAPHYDYEPLTQTVSFTKNVVSVWFYASGSASSSTEDTAIFKELQIEKGISKSEYIPHNTATDIVARENIDNLKDELGLYIPNAINIVNERMTKDEFITAFNGAMTAYAELNKCYIESFDEIRLTQPWNEVYKQVSHNLRYNIVPLSRSNADICKAINERLTVRVRRFEDGKLNNGNERDFSLNTEFQADEPSVVVSEDGGTMYIYAHLKRISSTDGVNWTEPTPLVLSDNGYIMHCGVNLIDGVYYLIGCRTLTHGDLILYTSEDGINFTLRGPLFKDGHKFDGVNSTLAWGNPCLIKECGSGKFYLYIENTYEGANWVINLTTCTDILHANADGTIGNWVDNSNNPIISKPYSGISLYDSSAGNVDFAKGSDNRPIRIDGKYYIYIHSTKNNISHILRYYSDDLINWTNEGVILDNRDRPTGGDNTSGNADHCIIEFKGRTYLFYTWDINNPNAQPYIKYTVDDRPIREILSLMP